MSSSLKLLPNECLKNLNEKSGKEFDSLNSTFKEIISHMSKFNVEFKSAPADLVSKIANKLKSKGGDMSGDHEKGDFEIVSPVGIKGEYKIVGQSIEIEITKKPMFVTGSMVEAAVSKEFSKIDEEEDDRIAEG